MINHFMCLQQVVGSSFSTQVVVNLNFLSLDLDFIIQTSKTKQK